MATSGTVNSSSWISKYGYSRYVIFTWEKTGFDVENQTTTISWKLTGAGSFSGQVKSGPFYINIDGEQIFYSSSRISLYAGTVIGSGTHTIKHNADGTKTFNVSVGAAIYSSRVNHTGSGNFTLDIVGKAMILTAPSFSDEDNPTITYRNTVGNAISSLSACISIDGTEPDIPYRDIDINGSSYTFNLTEEERNILRAAASNTNSLVVRFYVRSIIGGNYYFSWKTATLTIINATPSIAVNVFDDNEETIALTGNFTVLVKHHSTARAAMTATAKKMATITSTTIKHANYRSSERIVYFYNVIGNVFDYEAVDSRGNSNKQRLQPNMIEYIKPTVNILPNGQMNTEGEYKLKISGNYFNDTFGAVDNTISLMYRYCLQNEEYSDEWIAATPTLKDNTYTSEVQITGLDYRKTYKFQARVIDKLNTVLSNEELVFSLPVYHWGANDFVFEVPVNINGTLSINGQDVFGSVENLQKALSTQYNLTASTTDGSGFEDTDAQAFLVGNTLILYVYAYSTSPIADGYGFNGNSMMTVSVQHGGKIAGAMNCQTWFNTWGFMGCCEVSSITNNNNTLSFQLRLQSYFGKGINDISGLISIPVLIDLNNY